MHVSAVVETWKNGQWYGIRKRQTSNKPMVT